MCHTEDILINQKCTQKENSRSEEKKKKKKDVMYIPVCFPAKADLAPIVKGSKELFLLTINVLSTDQITLPLTGSKFTEELQCTEK